MFIRLKELNTAYWHFFSMENFISDIHRSKTEWKKYQSFKTSLSSSQAEIIRSEELLIKLEKLATDIEEWMSQIK